MISFVEESLVKIGHLCDHTLPDEGKIAAYQDINEENEVPKVLKSEWIKRGSISLINLQLV